MKDKFHVFSYICCLQLCSIWTRLNFCLANIFAVNQAIIFSFVQLVTTEFRLLTTLREKTFENSWLQELPPYPTMFSILSNTDPSS